MKSFWAAFIDIWQLFSGHTVLHATREGCIFGLPCLQMYIFSLQDADRERVVEAESLSSDLNDHPLLLVSVTSVSQSVS